MGNNAGDVLQKRLDTLVRNSLPTTVGALAFVYAAVAVGHILILPSYLKLPLALVAAATAAVMLAVRSAARNRRISSAAAQPVGAAISLLLILNAFLVQHLLGAPHQTTNFALIAVALGCFFLSVRWFALTLMASLLAWLVAFLSAPPSALWVHYVFNLLGGVVLGVVVFAIRLRALRHLEALRAADELRKAQLESAVHEGETRLRDVVSQVPGLTFQLAIEHDGPFRFLFVSEGPFLQAFGVTAADIERDPAAAIGLLLPEDRESVMSVIKAGGRNLGPTTLECRARHSSGEVRWMQVSWTRRPHATGLLATGLILDITERRLAQQAQQQEMEVSAALLRAANEMISSLDTATLLDRLCQMTVEILGCDFSHALLWDPKRGAYVPIAGHGDTPERWEEIRSLALSSDMLAGLMKVLSKGAALSVNVKDPPEFVSPEVLGLAHGLGVTAAVCAPMRRGHELIGFLSAGYRGGRSTITPQQERIADGIGKLAAMALTNARLVEQLKRAERIKSEFLNTMSHELRTPLHIALGYHELLLEGTFGPLTEEQKDSVRLANRSSTLLLELINNTLDVNRLAAGRVALRIEDVRIADVVGCIPRLSDDFG